MKRSDWLLLLLALRIEGTERSALDPVRVQKGMFLFAKEGGVSESEAYTFEPYNWGPYSTLVNNDLQELVRDEFAVARDVPGYTWKTFAPTADGVNKARNLLKTAPRDSVQKLAQIKKRVGLVTFNELLSDVYENYPEFATRSLFRPRS